MKSRQSITNSVDNLIFNGLIYRLINEPDGIRDSLIDLDTFLDTTKLVDLDNNIKTIEAAIEKIDRNKNKDGAFTALESFLQSSSFNLIIVDNDFNHIFHNSKSKNIVTAISDKDNPKKLDSTFITKLTEVKEKSGDNTRRLVIIPNAFNNRNAYLISNQHKPDIDLNFNILLLPNLGSHQFELQDEVISKYALTKKETEILSNLIVGYDVQQIAIELSVSLNTIRTHLKSIFRKTTTKSQSDLIRLFLQHESRFFDSYFDPIKSTQNSDIRDVSTDMFLKLSTGNTICYREFGPKNGRPLIVFHNLLGSRYNIPYEHSEILDKTNRKLIVPDRPGYGLSEVVSNYNSQWNEMFNEFIDRLNIDRFDLLGNISGTVNALNYAATCSEKLQSLIIVSPVFFNSPDQRKLLNELPYNASRLVSLSNRMATKAWRLWMTSMKYDAEGYVRKMINQYVGYNELHILDNQDYINHLVLNFTESQRNQSEGSAQDVVFSLTPLNLDLSKINVPIDIWIGDDDSLISVSSAKEICDPIPNKTFHVREGYGEEIYYHLFEEIIQ